MLGALLDFPELLLDPEVEVALTQLDGDLAMAVVALRHCTRSQGRSENGDPAGKNRLAADEFLAQIRPSIHSFAAGRLVSPAFEAACDAKAELVEHAGLLRQRTLKREKAAVVAQLEKGEAMGDVASEDALLRRAWSKR
jgi:DNA primase